MKPNFELPELLSLNGEAFSIDTILMAGNGGNCANGCKGGCCNGCVPGGGTGKEPDPDILPPVG